MSVVRVWHESPIQDNEKHYIIIDGDRLKQHSILARQIMDDGPRKLIYKIDVLGRSAPSLQAMKTVLQHINQPESGQFLHSPLYDFGLPFIMQIHRAVNYLRVEPPQPHIDGHLKGYLSHRIVSPEHMLQVHKYYGNLTHDRRQSWDIMIQTIAYSIVNETIDAEHLKSLNKAAQDHPLL